MFVRLYTGSDGQSHLEDMDMENSPLGYSVPQKATDLEFRNNVPDYLEGWHTAPTRQYVITLSGYHLFPMLPLYRASARVRLSFSRSM